MHDPQKTKSNIDTLLEAHARSGTWPDYERVLQTSYESFLQSDGVILDVGANIGTHLEHFVRIASDGQVIAFEPLPDIYQSLVERFQPDGTALTIHNLALSSEPAPEVSFVRANGSLSESGLRQREYNDPAAVSPSTISVRVDTIDEVLEAANPSRVSYIKMDIEGAEIDALRGATITLAKYRPIVSVEYGYQAYRAYGHTEDTLFDFCAPAGYRIFDPYLQFIGTRELWDYAKAKYCWDYFLVPAERAPSLRSPFFD